MTLSLEEVAGAPGARVYASPPGVDWCRDVSHVTFHSPAPSLPNAAASLNCKDNPNSVAQCIDVNLGGLGGGGYTSPTFEGGCPLPIYPSPFKKKTRYN